ncbi:MAG: SDR family oxidoreductase [Actinomycetota bacterium]|nr:SDR family oxidoreductase [Actinomycetota bacterium]
MSVAGKVVVITGSTRGIGRSIAEACAGAGAHVVVSSRTPEAVEGAVADIATADGGSVCGIACDVSDPARLQALFDFAIARYGHIDVWLNNAGVSEGYRPLDELSGAEIRSLVDINLTGTMLACRLLVPYFREHGGLLMNVTGRGYRGEATPYTAAYAATKVAIASLTRSIAKENARFPMSIHALVPGMVATDFYRDIKVSPRLQTTKHNWRYALDAFGVPLDRVGVETVSLLGQEPGRVTGKVYSLITPARTVRGILKIMGHRASGMLKAED